NSSRRISPGGIGSRRFLAIVIPLLIVHNLDLMRVSVLPSKADAPLVVDANAVLTLSVAVQRFGPIARRDAQVANRACSMQIQKLPPFFGAPVGSTSASTAESVLRSIRCPRAGAARVLPESHAT